MGQWIGLFYFQFFDGVMWNTCTCKHFSIHHCMKALLELDRNGIDQNCPTHFLECDNILCPEAINLHHMVITTFVFGVYKRKSHNAMSTWNPIIKSYYKKICGVYIFSSGWPSGRWASWYPNKSRITHATPSGSTSTHTQRTVRYQRSSY
jgi:hypothetical protein